MARQIESQELISGLVAGGVEPVEISLESMRGSVDLIDPSDFTDRVQDYSSSHKLLRDRVEAVMSGLSRREKTVLKMRFGLEDGKSQTLRQVGAAIGRSQSTAWRVQRDALQKLRQPSVAKPLEDYLA